MSLFACFDELAVIFDSVITNGAVWSGDPA